MTTPDVHCTCMGTCHPERLAALDERRLSLIFGPGEYRWMPTDTGLVHGPRTQKDDRTLYAYDPGRGWLADATDHIGRGTR